MEDVDLTFAKEHLEELIARAARGEDVRIAQPGIATVRLAVVEPATEPVAKEQRRPGRWKGRLNISDEELLEPMSDEELKLWYGDGA
jgi:antitoxin (DNA-binding transcriptional repressor) of toxin-antitoxin stability system